MAAGVTPTTHSTLLTTMAILLANYDAERDYLSNFEPFVIDRLKAWPEGEEARPKQICQALTAAYNLPRIPINTVTQLRDRVLHRGFLVRDPVGRIYPHRRALAEVPSLDFGRTIFLEHFDLLAGAICDYASEVHDRPWEQDDAERALESFVEEFSVELAMAKRTGEIAGVPTSRRDEELAVVHGFARRALAQDEQSLDYLEEVVQASMLANVVYLQDLGTWRPDLGDLTAYLDTTVAFRVLELTDGEVSEAAREMLELLGAFNVPVRVFDHTFVEMRGVLESVQKALREETRGKTNLSELAHQSYEVLTHALRSGWGPADVEEVIVGLEQRLAQQGIAVAAAPKPDPRLRLDERALDEILTDASFTPGQRAKDAQSLTAVHVLREGKPCTELGRARAVLITSNDELVKAGRVWFEQQGLQSTVPQCMTETSFTTQLWLRKPEGRPDVARKFLVAESFAALNPRPELWQRYLDRISQRRERDEITEEEVKALVFSTEAKEGLVEVAHGNPDRVDDRAIGEVLARAQERMPSGIVRELESTQHDIGILRGENHSMRDKIASRDQRLKDQSDELAAQNRELAALQKKLDQLIGSDERRSTKERAAAARRLVARRTAGALVAAAFVAAGILTWFFAGIDSGLLRGAAGFAAAGLAVAAVAVAFRKDMRWVATMVVLAGALPGLFFGLVGVADHGDSDPPRAAREQP